MEEENKTLVAVGYARIVRYGDLRELDWQAERIYDYCQEHGIELRVVLSEEGDGGHVMEDFGGYGAALCWCAGYGGCGRDG